MSVGNNIKKYRKEKNISQEELAAAIQCSVDTISRYETGKRCPGLEQAIRLARYFQMGLERIFYLEQDFTDEKGGPS